eukprot:81503-Prorocentrum_minimum.AAC.1
MLELGLELTLVRQSNYSPHQEVSPWSLSRTMISCIKAFVAFRAQILTLFVGKFKFDGRNRPTVSERTVPFTFRKFKYHDL